MSHTTNYVPPSQLSKLRACMICSFIQTYQKFRTEGCPNCDDIPEIDYQDNADEITSPIYEGMIALRDPERSWVARWQRVNTAKSGVYAVKVVGNLPDDIIEKIAKSGLTFLPRDGRFVPED
ncbi:transcription initiation Spt4 [Ascodesmis nigricans]|uniref:Transcription elongation factor SPT4 n=1 Tax=Ascodesmis nigricans TaxID=341454 RepID=A0A4S2N580_9PEZI|nr:transcription initiation Spt4 [Ascodesmis nigricans]